MNKQIERLLIISLLIASLLATTSVADERSGLIARTSSQNSPSISTSKGSLAEVNKSVTSPLGTGPPAANTRYKSKQSPATRPLHSSGSDGDLSASGNRANAKRKASSPDVEQSGGRLSKWKSMSREQKDKLNARRRERNRDPEVRAKAQERYRVRRAAQQSQRKSGQENRSGPSKGGEATGSMKQASTRMHAQHGQQTWDTGVQTDGREPPRNAQGQFIPRVNNNAQGSSRAGSPTLQELRDEWEHPSMPVIFPFFPGQAPSGPASLGSGQN